MTARYELSVDEMTDSARTYSKADNDKKGSRRNPTLRPFVHNNVHTEALDYMGIVSAVARLREIGFSEMVYVLGRTEGAIMMSYNGLAVR